MREGDVGPRCTLGMDAGGLQAPEGADPMSIPAVQQVWVGCDPCAAAQL